MKLVVDASVAVKWVVAEDHADLALDLLDRSNDLMAPDFGLVEICNVLWKKVRRNEISVGQANEAMEQIPLYFDVLDPAAPLLPRALGIATSVNHPVYDCLYFAYAERESATLITSDRRAHAKAQQLAAFPSRLLADGPSSPH